MDTVRRTPGPSCGRHIEPAGSPPSGSFEFFGRTVHAVGYGDAIGSTELVAARPDRWTEKRHLDRFVEGADRCVDGSRSKAAPPCVHHCELTLGTDENNGGAVGHPTTEYGAERRCDRNVTAPAVAITWFSNRHHLDSVVLVELGPRQVYEPASTVFEFVENHTFAVEVPMRPSGTAQVYERCAT